MRTLHPVGNRLVASIRTPQETTQGGIILTAARQQETEAIVVESNIEEIVSGDVIVFFPDSGVVVDIDGIKFVILNDKEVLGVIHG
jgi:co-chaperonin GroES (HSP10)